MQKRHITLLIALFVVLLVASQSMYTVYQTEQALVLELGKPVGEPRGPGLHFKLPFIQNVITLDSRILNYDARLAVALTKDKKAILLDSYARWRISSPLAFYQTLRTVQAAQSRLDDIIYSDLRKVVALYDMTNVVSENRTEIMRQVKEQANAQIKDYGVEIVDVRIKRTDLPPENQRAIFSRMKAERERQAMEYRSEGQREGTVIRSLADRERAILIATAQQKAQILRGTGDAEATRIFADAISQSPEFYTFSRSMDAYKKALKENTKFVLTSDDPFLRYLR